MFAAMSALLPLPPALAADSPALGPLPAKEAPKASMVEMGQRLFFDVRLSGDGAISCATGR